MKNFIREFIKKIILGKNANSESYVNYLRKLGCKVGERTVIFDPRSTTIDITRPCLIEIGSDVKITKGVTILTHGYDFSVLRNVYNETLGSSGKVAIGNNVFIGVNTVILKGVCIGSNVIIGANSLVNKDIPDNVVYAGNPAKFVMFLADYYEKRKQVYVQEAKELAVAYHNRYHKKPPIELFHEYYPLFLKRDLKLVESYGFNYKMNMTNPNEFIQKFLSSEPNFESYDKFLEWCGII